jgi:hypothetical protein
MSPASLSPASLSPASLSPASLSPASLSPASLSPESRSSAPADPHVAAESAVHAADSFSRGALQWGYFLLLNAIAGAIAIAFFVSVFYADGLDPYLMGTYQWLLEHPGVTSALAFSPLACSLLVGYGYASRARKRKKLAAAREAAAKARSVVQDEANLAVDAEHVAAE